MQCKLIALSRKMHDDNGLDRVRAIGKGYKDVLLIRLRLENWRGLSAARHVYLRSSFLLLNILKGLLCHVVKDVDGLLDWVEVLDLDKGITLGTGSESGGLYLFDDSKNISLGNVNTVMAFNVSKDLWHNRLGHPTAQVLNASFFCLEWSEKYVFIGYSFVKKAYKLFSLDNRRVLFCRDVKFYETVFPFKMKNTKRHDLADVDYTNDAELVTFFDNQTIPSPNDDKRATPYEEGGVHSNTDAAPMQHPEENSATHLVRTTLRKNSQVIEKHVNYSKLNSVNYCFATTLNKSVEPSTYYDVVKDAGWVEAMNNEIEALIRKNTWTITDLPIGRKAIDNKWLYKITYKSTGQVDKFKARVVAKGFSQKEGIDFDETFSPVVKIVTVRCLICIVVSNYWPLFQLDVNNTFLYGDLNEGIYMSLPLGFECADKNKVCKLNKALYGLKQALRQWNAKLTTVLVEHGFVQSKYDYSLHLKHTNEVFVALLFYVDDFIITGNSLNEIEKLKAYLKSKFMIKDLRVMEYFLGIEVLNNANGICMTQRKYWLELIHEFGLLAAKPVTTPLPENYVLAMDESDSDKSSVESEYRCVASATYEVIWIVNLLKDLCIKNLLHVNLYSNSSFAIQITANPSFHEKTKHFEVDVHFIREKVQDGVINTIKVASANQTADLFTKGHGTAQHVKLCKQLSLVNMFGKSSFLLLNILKGLFCQVVKDADGLLDWAEVLVGFILFRPLILVTVDKRLHKDGDADASFHFRNSDKYYHDPEECDTAFCRIWGCVLVTAFWLLKVAFCLLEDLIAFCFKTSLRFASRPHCVLLQDLTAFCFKTSLRFASTSLRFAQDLHCVLLEDHIAF
ncbi:ribonuclease H-like domain-containing protein [Tanacetum coccineum]